MDEPARAPKGEMTSLDIRYMVAELRKQLSGGIVRKVYQYGRSGNRQFMIEFFVPQSESKWLYFDRDKMFITRHKQASPQQPPSFCMFLRKHLMGKKVKLIRQHEFDRIVEIATDENVLVIEMFSSGNVILCDSLYKIIMPLEMQRWKGREIRPKLQYTYPPKVTDPFHLDLAGFRQALENSERRVAAHLATELGLGSYYANEVCARAGVKPSKAGEELKPGEVEAVFRALASLDTESPQPSMYPGAVAPFPMASFGNARPVAFRTMSEAFDEYFSGLRIEEARDEAVSEAEDEKERLSRVVRKQEEATGKWERIMKDSQEKANLIYTFYPVVKSAVEGISKARSSGMEWKEIKEAVRSEQTPEAEAIRDIREGDGIVVLEIGGKQVEIEFTRTVEENAARYYEDAKWARKKIEGARQASGSFRKRLDEAAGAEENARGADYRESVFAREKPGQEGDAALAVLSPASGPRRKKRWFEDFRWFYSSDGFLVVAGRNAGQNEMLLKRHTEGTDHVFHADIPGAAFVAIKSQGADVPEQTMREAAEFAAANSKAWARGLGTVDIYSVPRSEVSKTPPSGQYLSKGSFMIRGERKWFKNIEPRIALGVSLRGGPEKAAVTGGPISAVRLRSDYFVVIRPGQMKVSEVARLSKERMIEESRPEDRIAISAIRLSEFEASIPSGTAELAPLGPRFT